MQSSLALLPSPTGGLVPAHKKGAFGLMVVTICLFEEGCTKKEERYGLLPPILGP